VDKFANTDNAIQLTNNLPTASSPETIRMLLLRLSQNLGATISDNSV
jgi:hypothetical protein